VSVAARVILVLTLPAALACAALGPRAERARQHLPAAAAVSPTAPADGAVGASDDASAPDDDSKGAVDLYGNQVTDAVAKYKLDATGTLYELHSPQTELPRLSSPKS